MAWKQALGFTLASELYKPDSVYCVGFMGMSGMPALRASGCGSKPWTAKSFSEIEWLHECSIDPMLLDLLQRGAREITARDLATLDKWFGAKGKFPALQFPPSPGRVRTL